MNHYDTKRRGAGRPACDTRAMVTASFRFYQGLNDFLPRERRGHSFAAACARAATTKHMVEALGVPHTEVALLLVNGEPSGFDRMIEDGDRIAVYPTFTSIDIAPLMGVRAPSAQRPRFVADAHLGALARLLRMAGYDTIYSNAIHDDEVAALAADEGRVVLTRDRELLKRRAITHGCYIHALKPAAQMRELFDRLGLAAGAQPFTLCLHCNVPLHPVPREAVWDRLPARVRARHEQFNACGQCRRVYWKGSHYQRMAAVLSAAGIPTPT